MSGRGATAPSLNGAEDEPRLPVQEDEPIGTKRLSIELSEDMAEIVDEVGCVRRLRRCE